MVTITLDKERKLKLTMRGMLTFEEKTGKNLFAGFNVDKMTFKEITTLLWACLIHEDKELTYDNFVDMVDMSRVRELAQKCMECISESLEENDAPLVENPQNYQAG